MCIISTTNRSAGKDKRYCRLGQPDRSAVAERVSEYGAHRLIREDVRFGPFLTLLGPDAPKKTIEFFKHINNFYRRGEI